MAAMMATLYEAGRLLHIIAAGPSPCWSSSRPRARLGLTIRQCMRASVLSDSGRYWVGLRFYSFCAVLLCITV